MKLLVATTSGWQPATDPDMHVIPGEILIPAEQCDRRHCICRREFVGVTSYERTLHAKVVDLDISDDQLFDIAREYVVYMFGEPDLDEIGAYVHDLKIAEDAALAEPGAVIERWATSTATSRTTSCPTTTGTTMPTRPGDPRSTVEWKRLAARLIAAAIHCAHCGRPLDKTAPPHTRWRPSVDHIQPLAFGGHPLDPNNCRVVHIRCNSRLSNLARRGHPALIGGTPQPFRRKGSRQPPPTVGLGTPSHTPQPRHSREW